MRKQIMKPVTGLHGERGRYAHWGSKLSVVAFTFLFSLLTLPNFGQHNFVLYNNSQLPQANFQNPGQEIWMNGYLILPGLSGAHFDLFSEGPLLNQMGLRSEFKLENILSESLNAENGLSADAGSTILGFGFKNKAGFFHFKLREHFVSDIRYPKALFELVDNYYSETGISNQYPLAPLHINASHYRSFSLGYTHRFAKLSIGANIQYLQGIANMNINDQGLNVMYDGAGKGYFVEGKLEALTTGLDMYSNPKATNFIKGSGNSGFAADLGGVIHFSPRFELSFAALNIGKIFWNNHTARSSMMDETTVFVSKDSEEFSEELGGYFEALFEDDVIFGNTVNYQTPLKQKYLLGAKYFVRPATNIGLLLHTDLYNGEPRFGGALSFNTQYKKHIGFSLAVSKYQNENFDVGTGINFNLGPVQIYALTDNLISLVTPESGHRIHGQAGINFIFGKKTRAEAIVLKTEEPAPSAPIQPSFQSANSNTQAPVLTEKSPAVQDMPQEVEPVEMEVEEAPTLPLGYFEYAAQVSDSETNLSLDEVNVKIYRVQSRSLQILVHSEIAKDGAFSVPISRNYTHRVVIQKPGYHDLEKEANLESLPLTENVDTLSLFFFLIPEVKDSSIIENTVESAIAELTDFTIIAMPKEKEAISLGTYHLTGSTSLRNGAHHTNSVILRLKANDQVELLEKTNNYWWKVKFAHQTGYVKAEYLSR